jgi:hypothetical protein
VRLKLYLSMLWMAAKGPYSTQTPARAWAELLGLPDPDGAGARRIHDSLSWLERNGFVTIERCSGRPPKVELLDDAGRRTPYKHPAEDPQGGYIQLPETLWTKGWIMQLSGAAVALLLIFLEQHDMRRLRKLRGPFWLSPNQARRLYSLSSDTWTKGTRELAALEVVWISRMSIGDDDFDFRRMRNTYSITPGRLITAPDEPAWEIPFD